MDGGKQLLEWCGKLTMGSHWQEGNWKAMEANGSKLSVWFVYNMVIIIIPVTGWYLSYIV